MSETRYYSIKLTPKADRDIRKIPIIPEKSVQRNNFIGRRKTSKMMDASDNRIPGVIFYPSRRLSGGGHC